MRDRPSDFIVCLNPHLSMSMPGVRVEFDDSGNVSVSLDKELTACNCECTNCESDTCIDICCYDDF